MDLGVRRRVARGAQASDEAALEALYPHGLSLYKNPPQSDVTLQEFESWAVERVRVLRALLAAGATEGLRTNTPEWRTAAVAHLKRAGLKELAKPPSTPALRRRDQIAHFALRLAYCRSEELRRWFLARELELFRLRFSFLSRDDIEKFFLCERLSYEPISNEEKSRLAHRLKDCTPGFSHARVETSDFYRVHFTEAFDLMRSRRVCLDRGWAYIPDEEFITVLVSGFRSDLNRALNVTCKRLPELEVDQRIVSLLKGLHHSYGGKEYAASDSALPIEDLDALSLKAFPVCMRQLHEGFRANHHLKHGGRLQYGLFLKAAGVVYEDAMRFWRDEFTKAMDRDKFDKSYAYNIRYNYGLEGSKKNYSAFSCTKIIQGAVGVQDSHGCPFRHSDQSVLKNRLVAYNLNSNDIAVIVDLVKKGHYQIACSKYFDFTHGVQMELGINHPNQYFEESQNILSGIIKPNSTQIKVEKLNDSIKSENHLENLDDEKMET